MVFATQMICLERGADRVRVELDTTMRDTDANPIDVSIDNFSASGFQMLSSVNLQVGETITVGLPGRGMERATVVRSAPGRYGCSFVYPVSESYVAQLRSGTPNTVTPFPGVSSLAEIQHGAAVLSNDDRFPLKVRVAVILGLAATFWGLVIAAGALIL